MILIHELFSSQLDGGHIQAKSTVLYMKYQHVSWLGAGDEEADIDHPSPTAPSNRRGTVEFNLSFSTTADSPDSHTEDINEGTYPLISEDQTESVVEIVSQTVVTIQWLLHFYPWPHPLGVAFILIANQYNNNESWWIGEDIILLFVADVTVYRLWY